jgi:subtilisin
MKRAQRYVVVPNDNAFNEAMETESRAFLRAMSARGRARRPASFRRGTVLESEIGNLKVVDRVDLEEATLVEMEPEQARQFARHYPSLRIKREVRLEPMRASPAYLPITSVRLPKRSVLKTLLVRCHDAATGAPVANAEIVVLIDRRKRRGIDDVRTDAQGRMRTALPNGVRLIDAVIAAPLAGYWPAEVTGVAVAESGETEVEVRVVPLTSSFRDGLDRLVMPAAAQDGRGVRIAVVDTGTAPAEGLRIVHGLNTTDSEPPDAFGDNGSGHGSHVAGVIARMAPAADLLVYRVFTEGARSAGEIAIAKAIRDAVDQGCDLINLSLGQDTEPLSITRETRRARARGVAVVAAAGNDGMGPISFPARSSHIASVSACGIAGSWPKGAMNGSAAAPEPAPIGGVFFASFSNVGDEMDFIAPGVGIISFVGEKERGVMDGTSMASPAVTGLMARLLSREPALLAADRDQQRSDAILKLAYVTAVPIGFGNEYEGSGLIERAEGLV